MHLFINVQSNDITTSHRGTVLQSSWYPFSNSMSALSSLAYAVNSMPHYPLWAELGTDSVCRWKYAGNEMKMIFDDNHQGRL